MFNKIIKVFSTESVKISNKNWEQIQQTYIGMQHENDCLKKELNILKKDQTLFEKGNVEYRGLIKANKDLKTKSSNLQTELDNMTQALHKVRSTETLILKKLVELKDKNEQLKCFKGSLVIQDYREAAVDIFA